MSFPEQDKSGAHSCRVGRMEMPWWSSEGQSCGEILQREGIVPI